MNLQFYLEKLHDSDEFKDFMAENPKSYLCSGFFEVDFSSQQSLGESKQHLDFYSPEKEQIFSFMLEEGIKLAPLEKFGDEAPKKLKLDYDFIFEDLGEIISERMKEEKVKNNIQKLLISLQKVENKDLIVVTVFLSGLGILKVIIEPNSKKIIEFEKKSFFDMVKFVKKGN